MNVQLERNKMSQMQKALSVSRNGRAGKRSRRMRYRKGPYDNYIRKMCRALEVPLPTRGVLRMLGQCLDLVMVGCMKSTRELMSTKKVTPTLAKRGIMSFLRSKGVKKEHIGTVLKMCDDTREMIKE